MKKSIFLGIIALAAVSMTSCSNDEVTLVYPQDDAIEFGTYLGRDALTRGVVLDNNNLANFGVFASYTGETDWASTDGYNFMYNQIVEKSGSDWVYSPKKYWPTNKGDKISFFAYAPYATGAIAPYNGITVVSANDAKDAPVIKYTINADNLENQADFVADVLMNQVKEGGSTLDSGDRTVMFQLLHELTRLGFTAKLDRDAYAVGDKANQTVVNIKSITFLPADEFCTSADYTFATESDTPGTLKRGTWSNFTSTGALNIANLLNIATFDFAGYTTPGILVTDTKPVTLFKENATPVQEYLFLIPRGEAGISADGKVKIAVAYDIVTVDPSLNAGHSVTPATKIIEFPKGSLKQGVAYMFNLTFGLNEIKLEATVVDWDNATIDGNVDWPKVDA